MCRWLCLRVVYMHCLTLISVPNPGSSRETDTVCLKKWHENDVTSDSSAISVDTADFMN